MYGKYKNVEYSQNIMLSCVYRTYQLTTKKLSFKLEIYSDPENCFGSLGR